MVVLEDGEDGEDEEVEESVSGGRGQCLPLTVFSSICQMSLSRSGMVK